MTFILLKTSLELGLFSTYKREPGFKAKLNMQVVIYKDYSVLLCYDLGEAAGDSYGTATGPIFLDNIKCNGSEAHILSCPQLPLGSPHDCKHSEDITIKCSTGIYSWYYKSILSLKLHCFCIILATGCSNGDVRLVNGALGRGRVEICSSNSWGTICNDDWDESEAVVVCRQLNFNDGQGGHSYYYRHDAQPRL